MYIGECPIRLFTLLPTEVIDTLLKNSVSAVSRIEETLISCDCFDTGSDSSIPPHDHACEVKLRDS